MRSQGCDATDREAARALEARQSPSTRNSISYDLGNGL
jgi:hypothetical protein